MHVACAAFPVAVQADSAACLQQSQSLQGSLEGNCKQAMHQLAGSCSTVQAVAQQLDRHTDDVGSRLQQQAKVG